MSRPATSPPQKDGLLRHLAVAAVLAAVFYVAAFSWIERRRVVKGPWEIAFMADAAGHPSLEISQRALKIAERLSFPEDKVARTNLAELIKFREPTTNLPFGQMLMEDALYLPGTITLRLSGHLVEIMPRTLIVDKTEHPWSAGGEITLPAVQQDGR